jgi:hypothetical protein
MKARSLLLAGAALAASAMVGFSNAMPPMGQRYTPRFERPAPDYDGDGNKVKRKEHPRHNKKRRSYEWQKYAERVRATHTTDAFGNRQIDPRDDKYLHSHARAMRGLVRALDARSRFAA